MKDNIIYSTTTRKIGDENTIANFKLGIERLETSNFSYGNLNFCDIKDFLDENEIIDILKATPIKFNIAHAPIHYPFFFNNYYERTDRHVLENRIKKAIDISKEIGVKKIVIHIGTFCDSNYNYDIKKSVKHNIKYLEPFVKKAIENDILIAIENGTQMEKDEPLFKNSAPKIDELIQIVEYYNQKYGKEIMGICYDFGHANVAKADIYSDIKKIGNHLKVTHIHDNYGTDSHNQPYDGTINWHLVRKALTEINYDGELTSEVRYTKEELLDAAHINQTYDLILKIHKG